MKLTLSCLIILICSLANGQVTFQRLYSAAANTFFSDVAVTSDGGYIICGYSGTNSYDYIISKLDDQENVEWTKHIGNWMGNEQSIKIGQAIGGGYFVLGTTNSFNTYPETYLTRLDASGDILWNKTYTSSDSGYLYSPSIRQMATGEFIISATVYQSYGNYYLLIKTDASGNIIWSNGFAEMMQDKEEVYDVEICGDGGFIAVGDGEDNGVYIVRTDANGNLMWAKKYSSANLDFIPGRSIAKTSDGGFIVSGIYQGGYIGFSDAMLMKIDADGNFLWARTYATPYSNYVYGAAAYSPLETSDGGFIMNANFAVQSNYGGYSSSVPGLIKTNSSGKFQWAEYYTLVNSYFSQGNVKSTADGGFITAAVGVINSGATFIAYLIKTDGQGHTGCNESADTLEDSPLTLNVTSLSVTVPMGESNTVSFEAGDIYLAASSNCSTNVEVHELDLDESGISVYPNPAADYFSITNLNSRKVNIIITDVVGRTAFSKSSTNEKEITINISSWANGMYHLSVMDEDKMIGSKKLVKIK